MNFCFSTLGCKVNQFETQALIQLAQQRGHTIVDSGADVCILNTCTVTAAGTRKNLRELRRLQKNNPHAVIALCGCFAQTDPERAAALDGVSIVCGTSDRVQVLTLCEQAVQKNQCHCAVQPNARHPVFEELPAGVLPGHTRALLKIQDGCDNYCTYCIIPYARGHVCSLPLDRCIAQCQTLCQTAVREIVLTGIEIASYGRDLPGHPTLPDVTEALCRTAPDIRFRLGSLEPRIVTQEFCDRLSPLPNLALHFHLSLQSGCDATLHRMHRRYTTQEYAQAVNRLRRAFPSCSVTTDVIAGFPGETAEEWEQTKQFIRDIAFSAVHVFPYSERPGTAAASLPDSVPKAERARRAEELRVIAHSLERDFLSGFLGQTIAIVPERPHNGTQSGHSRWHFPVYLEQPEACQGKQTLVRIHSLRDGKLTGCLVDA
ncbi:MAG: tRNA (N(6)-L-threonylcarbamoyladenosine(37)-C(2))-methylthiotransferase MtaB [Eubacteriales bacterium]|nr:tRNA (N(6)-L-threonylcarbamoyladenosine(37)-C(2))-methylthiotransferase MtaB [Eubacteriales bacterium]